MRNGEMVTVEYLNNVFRDTYRFMNDMTPSIALNITTGQIIYEGLSAADPANGRQYPSKYGTQFFANDSTGLLTTDVIDRLKRVLGE